MAVILINGEVQQTIAATDRGLLYGDGLFETIAVRRGQPELWQAHMQRLEQGCRRLAIPAPSSDLLYREAQSLCGEVEQGVLKVLITRGSGGRGYRPPLDPAPNRLVYLHPWPEYADDESPAVLRLCHTRVGANPQLAGIKHLNRLEQVLARAEWDDEGIAEGLMRDERGDLIEGTMSNLFIVRDGLLFTPELSRCGVEGVMRRLVMELAESLGVVCHQTRLPVSELERAQECFITNSILGIRRVGRFETIDFGEAPLTERLQAALKQYRERASA
ncbi:MAG: aminodeoxychorismate lyase [Pseudomonadota bacterium]